MSPSPTEKRLRRAARIIVVGPDQRLLMFRYNAPDRPPFWVTTGGECDPGESFDDAARRELLEETGIRADPGPEIARMQPEFVTVEGEPVRADERFYIVHVDQTEIDTSRHTELERELMTEHRWFDLAELADWPEAVFPENLAQLVEGSR